MAKTKLLIFDFDGTLIDSVHGIHKALNIVAKEYKMPEFPHDLVKNLVGYGLNQLLKGLDQSSKNILMNIPEVRGRFLDVYHEISTQEIFLCPGVIEFLDSCPYLVAIASNKEQRPLKHLVQSSDLARFSWVNICGADTYSEKKPHPLPLQEVMKSVSVSPEETIMIGDGLPDAMASQAANVPFVGVDFGYARTEDLRKFGAQEIISNYSELQQAIQKIDANRL